MAGLNGKIDQAVMDMADKEGKYLIFSLAGEEYGIGILKINYYYGFSFNWALCSKN